MTNDSKDRYQTALTVDIVKFKRSALAADTKIRFLKRRFDAESMMML